MLQTGLHCLACFVAMLLRTWSKEHVWYVNGFRSASLIIEFIQFQGQAFIIQLCPLDSKSSSFILKYKISLLHI